jgi:hypothetical protein
MCKALVFLKCYAQLCVSERYKHTSLLHPSVNYQDEKVISTGPGEWDKKWEKLLLQVDLTATVKKTLGQLLLPVCRL